MEKGYYINAEWETAFNATPSQSTIKMEKGYYSPAINQPNSPLASVAIHNKNGKGLLRMVLLHTFAVLMVAIHNKNGKGLLRVIWKFNVGRFGVAIHNKNGKGLLRRKKFQTCFT